MPAAKRARQERNISHLRLLSRQCVIGHRDVPIFYVSFFGQRGGFALHLFALHVESHVAEPHASCQGIPSPKLNAALSHRPSGRAFG